MSQKLLIATHNQGKVREYRALLSDLPLEVTYLDAEGVTFEAEETGATFADNAIQKARAYATATGLLTWADDFGPRRGCAGRCAGGPVGALWRTGGAYRRRIATGCCWRNWPACRRPRARLGFTVSWRWCGPTARCSPSTACARAASPLTRAAATASATIRSSSWPKSAMPKPWPNWILRTKTTISHRGRAAQAAKRVLGGELLDTCSPDTVPATSPDRLSR